MSLSSTSRLRCLLSSVASVSSRLCSNEAKNAEKTYSKYGKQRREKYVEVPLETSLAYLKSKSYEKTYGDEPVWKNYRRNFAGQFQPKLRKTCIRAGELTTSNACPICRDENLLLHFENVNLLQQFIDPYSGETLNNKKTGLCRKRQSQLLVEILKAKAHGLIEFDVPFRSYDYNEYIPK
ncbi:small ribosomal subunit protein mS40-like [Artemia franciscana]|uniref:Small ribosomal subunit protein mS40 n=1 Tax=Artemia franciscana TaxID=6661 RepID=A0AA88HDW1_ARTSF|nr:hypothetical protein QYM36_015879 [Artemia franciscana]